MFITALIAAVFTTNVYGSWFPFTPPGQIRIIDGYNVEKGDVPYIVSLQEGGKHFCGGTILDTDTVVTAAHCLNDTMKSHEIKVVAGIVKLNDHSFTRQQVNIDTVYIHKLFSRQTYSYDIAIVTLQRPLRFNQWISAINLPPDDYIPKGPGIISGWGYSRPNEGSISNHLKSTTLEVLTKSECEYHYGDDFNESWLCALPSTLSSHEDACQGDSGGPLICGKSESYLCGIIALGLSCGSSDNPGIYTNVPKCVEWISGLREEAFSDEKRIE